MIEFPGKKRNYLTGFSLDAPKCQIHFRQNKLKGLQQYFARNNAHSRVGLAPVPHAINSRLCPAVPLDLFFCQGFIERNPVYFRVQFPVQLVVSLLGHILILGTVFVLKPLFKKIPA